MELSRSGKVSPSPSFFSVRCFEDVASSTPDGEGLEFGKLVRIEHNGKAIYRYASQNPTLSKDEIALDWYGWTRLRKAAGRPAKGTARNDAIDLKIQAVREWEFWKGCLSDSDPGRRLLSIITLISLLVGMLGLLLGILATIVALRA